MTTLPPIDGKYLPTHTSTSFKQSVLPDTLCGERWNVLKAKETLDKDLLTHYNSQIQKLQALEASTNQKAAAQYNSIFTEIKLSIPPLPNVHRKLLLQYCLHLIQQGSSVPYPNQADLRVWNAKHRGTLLEKSSNKINGMCRKLYRLIAEKDREVVGLQNNLYVHTEQCNIKKDAHLRWMMETNFSRRDEYFTVWNLVMDDKLRELQVLVGSKKFHRDYAEGLDTPDPDHGLTPLHYACKHNRERMVRYLVEINRVDVCKVSADGRTPLHYAAAYSTRNVILVLLSAGCPYDAQDVYGCTALDMAIQNDNHATLSTLRRWKVGVG
ncbi:hypothetical protein EON64_15235, partial [archaeon]